MYIIYGGTISLCWQGKLCVWFFSSFSCCVHNTAHVLGCNDVCHKVYINNYLVISSILPDQKIISNWSDCYFVGMVLNTKTTTKCSRECMCAFMRERERESVLDGEGSRVFANT